VESGENAEAIEANLKLTRTQSGEFTTGRELLTIAQMKAKNFSAQLDLAVQS
jgi:hypothetical protein